MTRDLRDTANLYRQLTDMIDCAVVLVDKEGNFVAFNEAALRMTGYNKKEFEAMNVSDIDVLEDRFTVQQRVASILDRGQDAEPEMFLTKHAHKNGRVLDVAVTARAVQVGNQHLVQAMWQNVTGLIQQRDEMQRMLGVQERFIQNVSHELRTPLTMIFGYAKFLQDGSLGDLAPAQQDAVNIIQRRSHSLRQLVADAIRFLELDNAGEALCLDFKSVNVATLARQLIGDFSVLAEEAGVTLQLTADDICPAWGDAGMIEQAIIDLVSNATKFSPHGGIVQISVRCQNGYTVVAVRDSGIGISSDQLDRIFDRFYQVDGSETRRYGGVGLGLAVVKGIVELHGGKIEVSSELGKGSVFSLFFPQPQEDVDAAGRQA